MYKSIKDFKFYASILIGITIGFSVPFLSISLELIINGLKITPFNIKLLFKGQHFYFISTFLYPTLFGLIAFLNIKTNFQNKKLIEQDHFIRTIFNSLTDCFLICDSNGEILFANKAYYDNYSNESLSAHTFLGIPHLKIMPEGQFFELKLKNNKNEYRAMHFSVMNVENTFLTFNKNIAYFVSLRDIEDHKRNLEIIEFQKKQIYEDSKNKALASIASGLSHELNNPLAILKGKYYLIENELKKNNLESENIKNYIESSKNAINRMNTLISNLFLLSEKNKNSQNLSSNIFLEEIINQSLGLIKFNLQSKNIPLEVNLNQLEREIIKGQSDLLSKVLYELLENSIDAVKDLEDPWIKLSVSKNEIGLKFKIIDSGKGIDDNLRSKIFEPMFSTKSLGKGTGLGLSLAKKIIEDHNGQLILKEDQSNTCFEFMIPTIDINNIDKVA